MQFEKVKQTKHVTQYPTVIGRLSEFCDSLYDELLTSGYSLLPDDVQNIVLQEVRFLAGWCRLACQHSDDDPPLGGFGSFHIDLDTVLLADEWVVIEQAVRSHCDLVQARRMEGSQALGVTPFGISSSEALQNHTQARETMKREAFHHAPFSVEYDD